MSKIDILIPKKDGLLYEEYETEHIIYGDTDSVVGSTVIETNNGAITIEALWDMIQEPCECREGKFTKQVSHIQSLSMNDHLNIESKNIKYVMKHRVKKEMFTITTPNNSVKVTADHSIMVLRDGNLVAVKPNDITVGDEIIEIV